MIECKNLSFGYSKSLLFNKLSATFEPGHMYGLLGKNGAGKTTFLKCICGLFHLFNGEVLVNGFNPEKRSSNFLKDIFIFPENFYLPALSGSEFLKLYSPFYPDFDQNYFINSCDEFELPLKKKLSELSFGQKKKFFLAFGLSTFAKIILLDEPTNGLDIPSKTLVRKKIAQSFCEQQLFIISTHQVRDIFQLFDSILILHNGKIILNATVDYINQNYYMAKESEIDQKIKEQDSIIYCEETSLDKLFLIKKENSNSQLDIELFFNAVISNPEKFQLQ